MAGKPRTPSEIPAQKTRTREHVIASQSVAHVEGFIVAAGHTAERFANDYGYDLNMFTYGPDGGQEPGSVFIQVKATENLPLLQDGKTVSFPVRWSDIILWRREPMPVILIVHDVTQQVAYWLYVQELLESRADGGGIATAGHISLHLNTGNIVDEQAVEQFRKFKQSVLGQTEGVKHMDKFHYLKVTHAALERALLELGFRVSLYETHRLYENKEHGTLLMLPPNIPMEQQVRPAHLSSARHAVVAFGVADEATLERLLMEQEPVQAKATARSAPKRRTRRPSTPFPAAPAEAH